MSAVLMTLELLGVLVACSRAAWRSQIQDVALRHHLMPAWLAGCATAMWNQSVWAWLFVASMTVALGLTVGRSEIREARFREDRPGVIFWVFAMPGIMLFLCTVAFFLVVPTPGSFAPPGTCFYLILLAYTRRGRVILSSV